MANFGPPICPCCGHYIYNQMLSHVCPRRHADEYATCISATTDYWKDSPARKAERRKQREEDKEAFRKFTTPKSRRM